MKSKEIINIIKLLVLYPYGFRKYTVLFLVFDLICFRVDICSIMTSDYIKEVNKLLDFRPLFFI